MRRLAVFNLAGSMLLGLAGALVLAAGRRAGGVLLLAIAAGGALSGLVSLRTVADWERHGNTMRVPDSAHAYQRSRLGQLDHRYLAWAKGPTGRRVQGGILFAMLVTLLVVKLAR